MNSDLDPYMVGARRALERLRGILDAAGPTTVLDEAVEELAAIVEALESTTLELQLQNQELAATQQELAAEERAYRELFEFAPDAYLVTDLSGRITEANRAAAALFDCPQDDLVGRLLVAFIDPARTPDYRQRLLELGRGARARDWELVVRPRRSTGLIVGADVEPARTTTGHVAGLRWTLRDVTDARRAQHALQQAFTTASERYEHLREIDQWKDAFLAAAAHDLRSPLAVIRKGAEALIAGPTEREQDVAQTAEQVRQNADRLQRLLDDLLDLDRFTRGAISAERSPTDVLALVERVVDALDLADHPVTVEGTAVIAELDGARVEQIVQNLLSNAAQHTAAGTAICVRVAGDADVVTIIVEDDGPGVPHGIRDDLFLPFVSVPTHAEDAVSTGIGLSLVDLFVQLHGGRVAVEDGEGGGARFVVELHGR